MFLEEEQEDLNIWDEPDGNIVVEKSVNASGEEVEVVKAASLNRLVERLTAESKLGNLFQETILTKFKIWNCLRHFL